MSFVSARADFEPEAPMFALILANSLVSTIPGVSGAGESPEKSLLVPPLDAELIINGELSGEGVTPNTPTGCPTPAVLTLAMMDLIGMHPLMIAAGIESEITVPYLNIGGKIGGDPRNGNAVPDARKLYERGVKTGEYLSQTCDMLVLGECLPGGTTTALCVLRALGYAAKVSSCLVNNPVEQKEQIAQEALARVAEAHVSDPLEIVAMVGDPMIPVAAGIAEGYSGKLFLAGLFVHWGTQFLTLSQPPMSIMIPRPHSGKPQRPSAATHTMWIPSLTHSAMQDSEDTRKARSKRDREQDQRGIGSRRSDVSCKSSRLHAGADQGRN